MKDLFEYVAAKPSAELVALQHKPRNAQMKQLAQEMSKAFLGWVDSNFLE